MSVTGRRVRAFTLIELLVVVAIIALLISILLPSLSKARETARTVTCLTIQKQISTANIMYADANDQWYVPFSTTNSPIRRQDQFCIGGGFWGAYIPFRQNLGLNVTANVNGVPNTGQKAVPGLVCPSKQPTTMIEQGEWYRTFAMNGMGAGVWGNDRAVSRARVLIPATKVMGMDSPNWNITTSTNVDPVAFWDVTGDSVNSSYMAYRHLEMANMVMHDGHAQTFTKVEAFPIHAQRITLYDPYKF